MLSLGPTWWDKLNLGMDASSVGSGFDGLVRISEKEKGQAGYIVLIEAEHTSIKRESAYHNERPHCSILIER